MGSKRPKWLIKQQRKRVVAARAKARSEKGNVKDLGVRRISRHGGLKAGHGV